MENSLVVSTIRRGAAIGEPSGKIYELHRSGASLTVVQVPGAMLRHWDPNPRGGMRGARGIAVAGDEVFVANYDSIFRYGRNWRLKATISHPDCADIHDIAIRDEHLWVASTRNDRLFWFDKDGKRKEVIDPLACGGFEDMAHRMRRCRPQPGDLRDPRTHDKVDTDRLHLNSFAFIPGGDVLLSFGHVSVNDHHESALVALCAGGGTRMVHHNPRAPAPSHNIVFLPDGSVLHADTANSRVIRVDLSGTAGTRTVIETDGFTRGLCLLSDGHAAVGVQNELWIFDLFSGTATQRIRISDDSRESIHSIAELAGGMSAHPSVRP